MRILATLALAILGGTAVAATVENIIVRSGEHAYVNGDIDASYRQFGERYAALDLDGVRYVITDEATLAKIDKLIAPQIALGERQAALGEQQAKLGAEQANIGAEQARIGAQQATVGSSERVRRLADRQLELAAKQRELGDRQGVLEDRQRELSEQQQKVSAQVDKELEKIFRNAARTGVAQRR